MNRRFSGWNANQHWFRNRDAWVACGAIAAVVGVIALIIWGYATAYIVDYHRVFPQARVTDKDYRPAHMETYTTSEYNSSTKSYRTVTKTRWVPDDFDVSFVSTFPWVDGEVKSFRMDVGRGFYHGVEVGQTIENPWYDPQYAGWAAEKVKTRAAEKKAKQAASSGY